jgi:hypothetical protein
MYKAQTRQSTARPVRLMSGRSAKRLGRWFAFAWLAMWIGTALLPCCEVSAAVAALEQTAHAACGHAGEEAPDPGAYKHSPCLDVAAPAPAQAEASAAPALGSLIQPQPGMCASSFVPPEPLSLSRPADYRAAPPPVAVYLRSLRLLI